MSEERLQSLADSAQLKILQYVVTALAVPGFLWFASRIIDDLDKIKNAQHVQAIAQAELVLRVQALERGTIDTQTAISLIREIAVRHEYDIARLHEKVGIQGRNSPAGNRRD